MVLGQISGYWVDQVSNEGTSYCCVMPCNRNKYRRQSLTEVRVNGQDIRVSPYLADAEHVRQMTELVCEKRPVLELADQAIALYQGKRDPVAAAIRAKQPSTNSTTPSSSLRTHDGSSIQALGDISGVRDAPRDSSEHASSPTT